MCVLFFICRVSDPNQDSVLAIPETTKLLFYWSTSNCVQTIYFFYIIFKWMTFIYTSMKKLLNNEK